MCRRGGTNGSPCQSSLFDAATTPIVRTVPWPCTRRHERREPGRPEMAGDRPPERSDKELSVSAPSIIRASTVLVMGRLLDAAAAVAERIEHALVFAGAGKTIDRDLPIIPPNNSRPDVLQLRMDLLQPESTLGSRRSSDRPSAGRSRTGRPPNRMRLSARSAIMTSPLATVTVRCFR